LVGESVHPTPRNSDEDAVKRTRKGSPKGLLISMAFCCGQKHIKDENVLKNTIHKSKLTKKSKVIKNIVRDLQDVC